MAGALYGFGLNNFGLLDYPYRTSPVQTLSYGNTWSAISCEDSHAAAIKTDNTLWMWGLNSYGQLADNTISPKESPQQTITLGSNWQQVACGTKFTAAIKTDGTLWLWGRAASGELGNNSSVRRSSPVQTVAGGANWSMVSCGQAHTAAIKSDGTLWTWGSNNNGQLGDNTTVNKSSPVQTITYGTNWAAVSCGLSTTAGIKSDGSIWLWGTNSSAQLGDNTTVHRSSPVQTIAGGTNWSLVSIGTSHTAAIKTDGTLWTWGANLYMGINTSTGNTSSPIQTIAGSTNWSSVSCGNIHTAAIKTDGTLWLWGRNSYGQLGDNTTTIRSSPIQIFIGGTDWNGISCGQEFTTATKKDGTLWLWGSNYSGQLGDNTAFINVATNLNIGNSVDKFSFGRQHAAAIKTDGTLWLWGRNSYGQLGDNTITPKSSPIQTIAGGTNWKDVFCGEYFTSAVKTDGTLWLWGRNEWGQIGDNTFVATSSPVQTTAYSTNWNSVPNGGFQVRHAAAIKTDGTLWLWGRNSYGQLGDNTITPKSSPVQTISGGNDWLQVSCGYRHTAAIKTDGTLWCWGRSFGALGDNANVNRSSPVQTIAGGTNWSYVFCGNTVTAAIKTDGTLWAWGVGSSGQLGDNAVLNRSSPVQTITRGTDWNYVTLGNTFTVASKTNGTLWAWGSNSYFNLIDGTQISKSSPVFIAQSKTSWSSLYSSANTTLALLSNKLVVNTQPQASYNACPFLVQPIINIDDPDGNIITTATNSITVAVQSGTATLSGTTTVVAVNGVATFTDLVLTGSGAVTLRFTSSGLTQVDSNSFTVSLTLPIIPKRSEVSGKLPTSGQLNIGELAVNIEDKKGYIKKSDGTIVNLFNGAVYDGGTF